MNENISITLHLSEVEDIIEDLQWSAKKMNLRHGSGAGQDQEDLANKIDLQLTNYLKKHKEKN
tara:strand:+ start:37 stop:225 length:189 start_codon:yes stop_codon:yes gene_type:complete